MASPRGQHNEHMTGDTLEQARSGAHSHGGRFATIISALALLFSGYSFYEAVLRAPEMAIYVPPRIAYTDPDRPDSPFEVFVIPVTLANDGARTGTVLSMDLTVKNTKTGDIKQFYSAQIGPWGAQPVKAYAPVSLPGRISSSQSVQFFPLAEGNSRASPARKVPSTNSRYGSTRLQNGSACHSSTYRPSRSNSKCKWAKWITAASRGQAQSSFGQKAIGPLAAMVQTNNSTASNLAPPNPSEWSE